MNNFTDRDKVLINKIADLIYAIAAEREQARSVDKSNQEFSRDNHHQEI